MYEVREILMPLDTNSVFIAPHIDSINKKDPVASCKYCISLLNLSTACNMMLNLIPMP